MNHIETPTIKIAFATLGCKVNQAESEAMMRELAGAGYELADFDDLADVYILNSCTVTHIADRKSRQLVRQARRHNPDAVIVVTGCYAELDGKVVATSIGADLVVGNNQKKEMAILLRDKLQERRASSDAPKLPATQKASTPPLGLLSRTRAMVKIQDGCNNFCSYCIVPLARGRERSVPIDAVLTEVKGRVEAGYKEIVLTGVHAGAYGKGLPGRPTIGGLVERILVETAVERLRLSSIEPWDLEPELLDFLGDPRFCRHFHLPLQSGSDSVLKRMRRHYTTGQFATLVDSVRRRDPDVSITTDVIVGFPGEIEEEFAESLRFCQEIGFAKLHVFRYSPRRDTRAAGMPDQVDEKVKKARSETMMDLSEQSASQFRQRFIGKRLRVLWEHPRQAKGSAAKIWTGLSDNYVRVDTTSSEEIGKHVMPVTITAEAADGLYGEIAESPIEVGRR